jgi:uncharacterized radical SAM superfamily Fe-S cluster-containing enzyme
MDANQVGFVHELTWDEHQDWCWTTAISIKPRRQMSVQFSGGEPTISPQFLDAVRYARKVGYNSVQAATNGYRIRQEPGVRPAAAEAGLRYAICSLTASATPPTPTAAWQPLRRQAFGRSRICTSAALTSCRSSRS